MTSTTSTPAAKPTTHAAEARAAERRAEAARARAVLAAGTAERRAAHERTRQRIAEERRRRDADPAERAGRDAALARVRAGAEAAREAIRRRLAASGRRSSPRRGWEPLSDDEWAVLSPFLFRHNGSGRPVRDPRGRLDAIFWLAARPQRHLPPWRMLPPGFGKHDTVARQFRRWAHAGLWTKLLEALADPDHPGIQILRRLESWICRSYRRAWRLLGVRGVVLARRLGFLSAMRAPTMFLPDPDLSEYVKSRLRWAKGVMDEHGFRAGLAKLPCPDFLQACHNLLRNASGGRRISRCMAPW